MAGTIHEIELYVANSSSYHHYWEHGNLFSTVDASLIRDIWTTVFVCLNLSIVLLGAFFLKSLNLHRLKKRKRVPVNRLTSWMSLTGALRYCYGTHQLPGGFYGLLMLATGVFGLAHQYFVNSFISRSDIQWECPFQSGVLTTHTNNTNLTIVPVSTFSAANTVYNAQYQVSLNVIQSNWGIYEKVNYNLTTFAPTLGDVMGGWNCFYWPNTTIAWADWRNDSSVQYFLQTKDFLFPNASAFAAANYADDNDRVNGFLAWSADQPDNSSLQWNVRASLANNLGDASADSTGTVTNLECQLVAANGWTLPSMPSNRSLTEWVDTTYGFLMTAEPQYFGVCIEWMLNAMVMVTGSGNNDQWNASDLSAGVSRTYGCTLPGTKIRPEIWIILGAILLVVVPLFLADTFLFLLSLTQRWKIDHAHLVKAAPSSVDEWQLALIIEKTGDDSIKATDMWDYSYGWDDDEAVGKQKCAISKNSKSTDLENQNRRSSSRVNPVSQSPVYSRKTSQKY